MQKPISKKIIDLLNSGQKESSNLMEFLAIDNKLLLNNVLPEFNCPELPKNLGITKKQQFIASELNNQFGFKIFEKLKNHKSDIIRNFACYLVGEQNYSFKEKLDLVRPLADDNNSGVREWAWMAIRKDFVLELEKSISLIIPWTADTSDNIRRFTSELSRPRGVWCKHISALREKPWLGIDILYPLRSDSAKYVQLSVGNWLNDAGKDHPQWVRNLCDDWNKESNSIETKKICKRALRNLK